MNVDIVVGLANLGERGRPLEDDIAFDPLMGREAAEKLIAEFRAEGIAPPAVSMENGRSSSSPAAGLARANVMLTSIGLPTHREPSDPPAWEPSVPSSLPVEALWRLRRVMAHHLEAPGQAVEPLPEGEDPRRDRILREMAPRADCHLLNHSEKEGFYVPISFSQVVRDPSGTALPGGWLGSSHRLREEMVELAPLLELEMTADGPARHSIDRVQRDISNGAALHLERWAWLLHAEAAHASIEREAAIVYD